MLDTFGDYRPRGGGRGGGASNRNNDLFDRGGSRGGRGGNFGRGRGGRRGGRGGFLPPRIADREKSRSPNDNDPENDFGSQFGGDLRKFENISWNKNRNDSRQRNDRRDHEARNFSRNSNEMNKSYANIHSNDYRNSDNRDRREDHHSSRHEGFDARKIRDESRSRADYSPARSTREIDNYMSSLSCEDRERSDKTRDRPLTDQAGKYSSSNDNMRSRFLNLIGEAEEEVRRCEQQLRDAKLKLENRHDDLRYYDSRRTQ